MLDQGTVNREHLRVGQMIQLAGNAPAHRYTVAGVIKFADASGFGAIGIAAVTLPEAQRIAGEPGGFDQINVAAQPGVSDEQLRARIRAALPHSLDVRTGAQQAAQQTSDLSHEIKPLRTFLLIFAYVSLFVGAFIIFNTFSITVTQRTREFGLLRTLGATRRQLMLSVVAEGVLLGLLGSLVGLLAGLAIAPALDALFKAFGADLPDNGTVLEARTIWVCLLAGTLVTVLAGLAPALRATRVPPIAAMREGVAFEHKPKARTRRRRIITGVVLLVLAVYRIAHEATSGGSVLLLVIVIVLALGLLIAGLRTGKVSLVSLAVTPLARLLGNLVTWRGITGRLARDNAMRQPGRTAVTAAALMIGLALVTFVSVLAASSKATLNSAVEKSFAGNLIVENSQTSGGAGSTGIPQGIAAAVRTVAGVANASPIAFSLGKIHGVGANVMVSAIDPGTFASVYRIDWEQGTNATLHTLGDTGTVLTKTFANKHHYHFGQRLAVLTPANKVVDLTVRGIANDNSGLLGDLTITRALARQSFAQLTDAFVFLTYKPGYTDARVQPAVDRLLTAHYPQAQSRTAAQFKADFAGQINSVLALLYVLLALSIIVSLFGIVTTLVLSIYERRRELGRLRAIGARRRQIRQMIRYESVITALIGGVLGIVLGLLISLLSTAALASQGIVLSIPVVTLIILLILAGLAGVGAAVRPAARRGRGPARGARFGVGRAAPRAVLADVRAGRAGRRPSPSGGRARARRPPPGAVSSRRPGASPIRRSR